MRNRANEKKVKAVPVGIGILVFLLSAVSHRLGEEIAVEEIKSGAYLEKMKPISAVDWIAPDSAPTVVVYGTHDRIQPFQASLRLKAALEENGVNHQYFECPPLRPRLAKRQYRLQAVDGNDGSVISTNICR